MSVSERFGAWFDSLGHQTPWPPYRVIRVPFHGSIRIYPRHWRQQIVIWSVCALMAAAILALQWPFL